jgi:hypothetical protein
LQQAFLPEAPDAGYIRRCTGDKRYAFPRYHAPKKGHRHSACIPLSLLYSPFILPPLQFSFLYNVDYLVEILNSLSTDVTNNLIAFILFIQAHVEITIFVSSVTNTSQYQSQFEYITAFDNIKERRWLA